METILVIDDEEVQREALAAHLRKQGFQVLCAENGRRGLELLAQHLVGLIITDGRMPELDGMGVLREARRLNPAVEVEDSGSGIAPEHLEQIFDLYFTTKAEGTGLGLSLVQRIVTQHGGRVQVHSTPGAGSRFTLSFPASA